jgi:hypothetical protein
MRFSLKHHGQLSCVEHCPEGEYVLHSDYARLKSEVERLTQLNSTLALRYDATNSMLDGCAKEIEEMEAEIERLTKAGDAMAKLLSCCGNPQSEVRGWNAAKEGKGL